MKQRVLMALVVGLVLTAEAPGKKPAKSDKDMIQGTWLLLSAQRSGEPAVLDREPQLPATLVFKEDSFTMETQGRKHRQGTYELDAAKKPRTIDFTMEAQDGSKKEIKGIYSLTGRYLKICIDKSGKERPKTFTTKENPDLVLMSFKRQSQ